MTGEPAQRLYQQLCALNASQLEDFIAAVGLPKQYLPGTTGPQADRAREAVALIDQRRALGSARIDEALQRVLGEASSVVPGAKPPRKANLGALFGAALISIAFAVAYRYLIGYPPTRSAVATLFVLCWVVWWGLAKAVSQLRRERP